MINLRGAIVCLVACLSGAVSELHGQVNLDPRRVQLSRPALESLLTRLDQAAESPVYGSRLRERSRTEANLIRARLGEGDFQVGDRIYLRVDGQQALTDTFTVEPGGVITLPEIGAVSLAGVLRSELTPYLTSQITRFVRDPIVRARSAIRIAILGEVRNPGYYTLYTETLVDEAIMSAAKGPGGVARLLDMRIERNGENIWEGDELQLAISEGRTFDALSLRSGDRIVVPKQVQRDSFSLLRSIGIAASLPFTIIGLINLFK